MNGSRNSSSWQLLSLHALADADSRGMEDIKCIKCFLGVHLVELKEPNEASVKTSGLDRNLNQIPPSEG
jgi:hypothetical protein